jgi:hypothetical protein
MKKIAGILIDYGMDFQYENNGSDGEVIRSYQLGIDVCIQKGKIYFDKGGDLEILEESEKNLNYVRYWIDEACIEETT